MLTLPQLNLFILIVCAMLAIKVDAQVPETNPEANAANHWIFGKDIHLKFTQDSVIELKFNRIDFLEGATSYYSEIDSLLIYACLNNGTKLAVNDSLYNVGLNREGTQGNLILRQNASDSLYILVSYITGYSGYYTLNLKTGEIYSFRRFAMLGGEKQQAINHQNSRDIWYANHAREGDSIYFYLVKNDGIVSCPVKAFTDLPYQHGTLGFATQGQMKFSSDGQYLAEVSNNSPFGYGLYNVDLEYPVIEKIYVYYKGFTSDYTKRWPSGLEFSANGKYLYITAGRNTIQEIDYPPVLYQINIDSLAHYKNFDQWISLDTFWGNDIGDLQLGPDHKIYYSAPGKEYLGVIKKPEEYGLACEYDSIGFTIDSGGYCWYGLPTFNQSYFYTPAIDFKYKEYCFSNTYQFEGLDTFGANEHSWRIENVNSGTVSTQNQKNIEFQFEANGLENKYKVTYIANNGVISDSVSKTITIRPKLVRDFLGRDSFYCKGETAFELTLNTPPDLHCIHWNGEEPYRNLLGDTIIGYENFYGHVHENQSLMVDTAGTYTCRITNKTFCQAWDTITIEEKPLPDQPSILRSGQTINSSIAAAQYHWYRNGELVSSSFDDEITPDTNGYYQLQLESEFGCLSTLSDSFLVDFASIEDPNKIQFSIYPNPSNGTVNISLGQIENYGIKVYDAQGKLVLQAANVKQFELSEAGHYVVEVHTEKGVVSKAVVIQ
ncbi:T9SS type A sorting domain-containing protein [bacterium]|nr:T9SS type A sorting domain-containing protein [bacterium]